MLCVSLDVYFSPHNSTNCTKHIIKTWHTLPRISSSKLIVVSSLYLCNKGKTQAQLDFTWKCSLLEHLSKEQEKLVSVVMLKCPRQTGINSDAKVGIEQLLFHLTALSQWILRNTLCASTIYNRIRPPNPKHKTLAWQTDQIISIRLGLHPTNNSWTDVIEALL